MAISKLSANDSSARSSDLSTESCESRSGFQRLELESASFNRKSYTLGTWLEKLFLWIGLRSNFMVQVVLETPAQPGR